MNYIDISENAGIVNMREFNPDIDQYILYFNNTTGNKLNFDYTVVKDNLIWLWQEKNQRYLLINTLDIDLFPFYRDECLVLFPLPRNVLIDEAMKIRKIKKWTFYIPENIDFQ